MFDNVLRLGVCALSVSLGVRTQEKERLDEALRRGDLERAIVAHENLDFVRARANVGASADSTELDSAMWRWLSLPGNRRRLAWVHGTYVHNFVGRRLTLLHRAKPDLVEAFPDLAFAFAATWRAGTVKDPRLPRARPDSPSMLASFQWYATRADRLSFPIREAPWPLLVHLVADTTPLEERERMLSEADSARDKRQDLSAAQLRAHGFPAASMGEGNGACWVERDGGKYRFVRASQDRSTQGTVESSMRLLVRALNHSVEGLRKATIVAEIHRRTSQFGRSRAWLVSALKLNPYSQRVWQELGRSVLQNQALSESEEVAVLRLLPDALAADPQNAYVYLWKQFARKRPIPARVRAVLMDASKRIADICASRRLPYRRAQLLWRRARLAETEDRELAHALFGELVAELAASDQAEVFGKALSDRLRTLRPGGAAARLSELEELRPKTRVSFRPSANEIEVVQHMVAALRELGKLKEALLRRMSLLRRVRPPAGNFASGLRRTPVIGGAAGKEFADHAPKRAFLAGFRYTVDPWHGNPVIGSLQPIYMRGDERILGKVYGKVRGEVEEVVAKDGFVVSGLCAKVGGVIDGFCLVFSKRRRRGIASKGSYASDWIGGRSGGGEQLIGSRGHAIVGLRGRTMGERIDAIGLIETK